MNCSFAVAAEGEAVGHIAASVLAEIECVFPLMRVFGVPVGDNHLR